MKMIRNVTSKQRERHKKKQPTRWRRMDAKQRRENDHYTYQISPEGYFIATPNIRLLRSVAKCDEEGYKSRDMNRSTAAQRGFHAGIFYRRYSACVFHSVGKYSPPVRGGHDEQREEFVLQCIIGNNSKDKWRIIIHKKVFWREFGRRKRNRCVLCTATAGAITKYKSACTSALLLW